MSAADAEMIDPLDAYMASLELPGGGSPQQSGSVADAASSSDPDVREWRRARASASSDVVAKNRRYRRLQQLLQSSGESQSGAEREDAYFSDAMMQERSPALFHFYVGQYLDDKAGSQSSNTNTAPMSVEASSLSSFLIKTQERAEMETRRQVEQEGWGRYESRADAAARKREERLFEEEEAEEEEDDSSEEEEEMKESEGVAVSIEERRRQLVEVMSARFLQGDDSAYVNYAEVDTDEALDDVDEMDRDAQDRYFATDE